MDLNDFTETRLVEAIVKYTELNGVMPDYIYGPYLALERLRHFASATENALTGAAEYLTPLGPLTLVLEPKTDEYRVGI